MLDAPERHALLALSRPTPRTIEIPLPKLPRFTEIQQFTFHQHDAISRSIHQKYNSNQLTNTFHMKNNPNIDPNQSHDDPLQSPTSHPLTKSTNFYNPAPCAVRSSILDDPRLCMTRIDVFRVLVASDSPFITANPLLSRHIHASFTRQITRSTRDF